MKKIVNFFKNQKKTALLLPGLVGAILIVFLGRQTISNPLLEDHCMKTSKSIEVAYNIVRYKDPINQYVDWHATPDNPKGRRGSLMAYESPLSAYLLASIYKFFDSADFMTRVNIARYFTMASLIISYLLLFFFLFKDSLLTSIVFTFVYAYSFFSIYYSTKPQAETYSLMYQALFIVMSAKLLKSKWKEGFVMIALAAMGVLLITGGKMNYFIVVLPLMLVFPFISDSFKDKKHKIFYYACFGSLGAAALVILSMMPGFSLERMLLFMVKGNKPIIENSLWKTFIEGFKGFPNIYKRTETDFGAVAFFGGVLGSAYLILKFIYFHLKKDKRILSDFERCQHVLFFVLIGHLLNYVVLRNLFIPHRYYVLPLYTIFCLNFTVLIADMRRAIKEPSNFKSQIASKYRKLFAWALNSIKLWIDNRLPMFRSILRLALLFFLPALGFRLFGKALFKESEFRGTVAHMMQYFGNADLAVVIDKQLMEAAASLYKLGTWIFWALTVVVLIGLTVACTKAASSRTVLSLDRFLNKIGLNTANTVLAIFFVAIGGYHLFENTKMLYENAVVQQENVDMARSIEAIRNDTESGGLVLCWKPCFAFYADKRSIMQPNETDLDFYIENDVHSLLGPIQPLDLYYDRLKKYKGQATYYKLKQKSEIEKIRKGRDNGSDPKKHNEPTISK